MPRKKTNLRRGFIALVSVIIISFILVTGAIGLNFTGFYSRFNVLDSETKERVNALARGCAEKARLELAMDINFIGKKVVNVNSHDCEYAVFSGGKINTKSKIGNIYTYYELYVDLNTPEIVIISFEELPILP